MRINIDDPIIDLVLEKDAEKITTPLEEWNNKGFKSNNYGVECVFRNGFKNGYTYSA
mgnify:CR=1 FL=1